MIPAIIVSVVAVAFGDVVGVAVPWARLMAIAFGGALVILAWGAAKFVVRKSWRGVAVPALLMCFVVLAAANNGIDGAALIGRPTKRITPRVDSAPLPVGATADGPGLTPGRCAALDVAQTESRLNPNLR